MREDKKTKKKGFRLRVPFRKKLQKRKDHKSSPIVQSSPSKTVPNTDWEEEPYEPPSPESIFGTPSYTEAQMVDGRQGGQAPPTEIQVVEEPKPVETNEGWAKFDAKPVQQLPKPEARSRKQLKAKVSNSENGAEKETLLENTQGPVDMGEIVQDEDQVIEVMTPPEKERRDSTRESSIEKRDEAEQVVESKKPPSPVAKTKKVSSQEPSVISVETEKTSSTGKSAKKNNPKITIVNTVSSSPSDEELDELDQLRSKSTEKTKLSPLTPSKSDRRIQSRKQSMTKNAADPPAPQKSVTNNSADPPAPHSSDNSVWFQFGLPLAGSDVKISTRSVKTEKEDKKEDLGAVEAKTAADKGKKLQTDTQAAENMVKNEASMEKTATDDKPKVDAAKTDIPKEENVKMVDEPREEVKTDKPKADAAKTIKKPSEREISLDKPKEEKPSSVSPTRDSVTTQKPKEATVVMDRAKECSLIVQVVPNTGSTKPHENTAREVRKDEKKEADLPSIAVETTNSTLTAKAGSRKIFAESMKAGSMEAPILEDGVMEEVLSDVEEFPQDESTPAFDDSFEPSVDYASSECSDAIEMKSKLIRFIPTMNETGETELVAVDEDGKPVYDFTKEVPTRSIADEGSSAQEESVEDSHAREDQSFLPGTILAWFKTPVGRQSQGYSTDDNTITTKDYSVYSSDTRGFTVGTAEYDTDYTYDDSRGVARSKSFDTADSRYTAESRYTVDSRYTAESRYTADSRYTIGSKSQDTTEYTEDYTADTRDYGADGTVDADSRDYTADGATDDYSADSREYTAHSRHFHDQSQSFEKSFETDVTLNSRETTVSFESNGFTSNALESVDQASMMHGTRTADNAVTSTSFIPRTLPPRSKSFTDDDYEDDETINTEYTNKTMDTEYTNNEKQPSALDELADMAQELRMSGPGVIMNWLT